ncbi:hypothetical protein QBC43DRAFT_326937 [Cladorrhinum sp. PSN259]|nr:hypothetical protein QBC43DRAFT_326937 [Cladorrhinum sp. PSN259]
MICNHCPDKKFESEAEFEEHIAEHARIQQALRRRGGRTYGARMSQEKPQVQVSPQGPILPVTTPSGTTTTVASSASSMPLPRQHTKVHDTHDQLARHMSNDPAYLIFRRFSALNIRNILRIQTEIVELEERLQTERENGFETSQLEYLIETRLQVYNKAVTRYSHLSKLGRPEHVPLSDLRRWASHNLDISPGKLETRFLEENRDQDGQDDLMSLADGLSQKNWLYHLVESISWRLLSMPIFGGRTISVSQTGKLHLYDDDNVRLILRAFLTAISSVLLLVPIGILSMVENRQTVIGIVALCCTVMAVVMAVATACRDHEIIMAVSAYAAVLIVFADK